VKTLKKRADFSSAIDELLEEGNLRLENMVFIDEAGSKLGMSREYGRAASGSRLISSEPKNKGDNISIVGAMGIYGVIAVMCTLSTMNGDGFLMFIEEYLCPNLESGQVVFMDNINFHHQNAVAKAIDKVGAKIVFLPPYSPEFNPIEHMWSKIKAYLRSKVPTNYNDYITYLREALETVDEYDCKGWFENSGYIQ